jgi:hypothetical protein
MQKNTEAGAFRCMIAVNLPYHQTLQWFLPPRPDYTEPHVRGSGLSTQCNLDITFSWIRCSFSVALEQTLFSMDPQNVVIFRTHCPFPGPPEENEESRFNCIMFVKIRGYHGCDYEECRLLRYKNPVRTSKEAHYVCYRAQPVNAMHDFSFSRR